ncbi:AI-2E family transporter [Devosia sp.]|uniref:AI-2E family transporter n=1 Tax=Devosia sp. TaxID=1871048 RepID=UPI003A948152
MAISFGRQRPSLRLAKEIQQTNFERVLGNSAQIAVILIGVITAFVAIQTAQFILAPVFLAVVIGLMFGPVADAMEQRGVPEMLSAAVVVLLLLAVIVVGGVMFFGPLAEWSARLPQIWVQLQEELANLRQPLEAIGALQDQVSGILGGNDAMSVSVEDSSTVTGIALMAPSILAQVLMFLVSLYFFIATRENIRISVLSLCVSRRLRWRAAHAFRDVEQKVSKYLLTITMVNIGVGTVVGLLMWGAGMPTPLLWGALAAVLNYIPFVGQAFMAVILFLTGLGTTGTIGGAFLPVALYWSVNFVEGNFVTPNLLGHTMTINPFMIFLSLTIWLWAWGPVGGLVAIPSLLMLYSFATHILPTRDVATPRQRRRLARGASADTRHAEPVHMPPSPESEARFDSPAAKPAE